MPSPQWRHPTSLIGRLIDRPQQFEYFQAVRVIELWLRRGGEGGGRTLDAVLRFKNSVSLRFPPSQIEALTVDAEDAVHDGHVPPDASDRRRLRHIHLTPAFMGLLGVHGALPYHYTETIAAQVQFDKNEGGRAFFDSFSHRSMTLFYRAWEKCRVEYRRDGQGRDGFLALQLALAGKRPGRVGAAAPEPGDGDGAIADEVVARYAALIRHRPLSAEAVAGVLAEYFGLPFRLEPFVGAWEYLPVEEQSRLDGRCQLGVNAMLGARYWRRDLCARLWVGPLARADFDRFLPDGDRGKALKSMLALFAVAAVRFEVRLILRAADVTPAALDSRSRLGYGAFLVTRPQTRDRHDTCYHITF